MLAEPIACPRSAPTLANQLLRPALQAIDGRRRCRSTANAMWRMPPACLPARCRSPSPAAKGRGTSSSLEPSVAAGVSTIAGDRPPGASSPPRGPTQPAPEPAPRPCKLAYPKPRGRTPCGPASSSTHECRTWVHASESAMRSPDDSDTTVQLNSDRPTAPRRVTSLARRDQRPSRGAVPAPTGRPTPTRRPL